MDCSLPGSSVCGILQAQILEWVAIPCSRGSSPPRHRTRVSCIAGRFLTVWAIGEAHHLTQDVCEFWVLQGLLCNFWWEGVLTFWFLQVFHVVGVDGYVISRPIKGYFIRHYLTHCFLPRVQLLSPDTEIPTHLQLPCSHPPHPRTGISDTTPVPSGPGPGPGQSWAVPHTTKGIFNMALWKVSPRLAPVIWPFHTQKGNESWDHYTHAKDT